MQRIYLHAGTVTLMCVSKPEIPSGTLVYIKILDIHVYTDHTSTKRTGKIETQVFILKSGYALILIVVLSGCNVELKEGKEKRTLGWVIKG